MAGMKIPAISFCGASRTVSKIVAQKLAGARRFCHRAPLLYQPTCKPGSVGRNACALRVTAIPLGRRLPGASSNLPGRQDPDRSRDCSRAVPIRSCSRWGLPCRRRCRRRGALLPHPFTLAATIRDVPRRSALCGTFPEASPVRARPRRTLSGTVDPWSPDFPPRRPFGPCRSGRPAD